MSEGVIYLLTFSDGRKYVGQTVDLRARLTRHRTAARAGAKVHVSMAWAQLGEPAVSELCRVPRSELDAMERRFIALHNTTFPNGLNRDSGGRARVEVCADTRELHREANRRRYSNPAERERARQQMLGRYQDPNERAEASRVQVERYKDPVARAKTGAAMREDAARPERKASRSRASKAMWQDPAYRADHLAKRAVTAPRGEGCSWAKLTVADVLAIRAARDAQVPLKQLAEQYGVSPSMVSCIGNRNTWKHVP